MNTQDILHIARQAIKAPVYSDPRFPPSLYYRFLRLLAAKVKPRHSVELGVCGGGGSLHLALGYPAGLVLGVDITNDYPENIKYVEHTCSNFRFLMEDAEIAAGWCKWIEWKVDILFLDITPTYEQTMGAFWKWQPLMYPHGILVIDDLLYPGMEQAWNELPGEKIRLDFLHLGGGSSTGGFGVILL